MINRREFAVGTTCIAAAAGLGLPGLVWAQKKADKIEEGRDYRTLDKPVRLDTAPGKIEVVEFFWYSCPHCNAFEPQMVAWSRRLPPDVVLRRVPVAFRDDFVPQQRLFYTLEAMGKLDALHAKVFESIHAKHEEVAKEPQILAWAEKNGLDKARFKEIYNSFSVSSKASKARQLQDSFQVEGVPALGIAGRWYTDGTMAGHMGRALQVVDFLVAEARKSR